MGAGDLEHSVSGEMSPWLGHSSATNRTRLMGWGGGAGGRGASSNRSLRLPPAHPGLQT
jgi:hypothetical protein